MNSMTGYGRGEATNGDTTVVVEIKSVNNRFRDLNLRVPREYMVLEPRIHREVQERVHRGRLDVFVRRSAMDGGQTVVPDLGLAIKYEKAMLAVAQKLGMVYGAVNGSDVFVAASIKTAEAAKIIENAQRDINIAFINEVTMIFERLGISVFEVLDASATKWNFLPFRPGLVGGHCIGVDPYYLAHKAVQVGHQPEVILAGRRINDGMGEYVADRLHQALGQDKGRVLVLGLTFKENVPDLRNAKVVDVIKGLQQRGHTVDVHDPLADPAEALREYTIALQGPLTTLGGYDCVLGAVAHEPYRAFAAADLARLVTANGLVADLQGMWRRLALPSGLRRWQP